MLHKEPGSSRSSGRGYECGSLIAKPFDPHAPPADLTKWLDTAFAYYDAVFEDASKYIESSIPRLSARESHVQTNSAITGQKAEEYFMAWAPSIHPEWGEPVDQTDKVGLGFDVEFPTSDIKVEVKGCRKGIEAIRMTQLEWDVAKRTGSSYVLAIVSHLDTQGKEQVTLIRDPYQKLNGDASRHTSIQVSFVIPPSPILQYLNEKPDLSQ